MEWINKNNHKRGRRCKKLEEIWKYGQVNVGYSTLNKQTINYVMKYITKEDKEHKGFRTTILTSPGIGKAYTEKEHIRNYHKYQGKNTITAYRFDNGSQKGLPQYYRKKFWTDEQREELRLIRMKETHKYVCGKKFKNYEYDTKENWQEAMKERVAIFKWKQHLQNECTRLGLWSDKRRKYKWKDGEVIWEDDPLARFPRDEVIQQQMKAG
jgi:hypothetical protein